MVRVLPQVPVSTCHALCLARSPLSSSVLGPLAVAEPLRPHRSQLLEPQRLSLAIQQPHGRSFLDHPRQTLALKANSPDQSKPFIGLTKNDH
eukprot:2222924-Amphidinium_carterae.1